MSVTELNAYTDRVNNAESILGHITWYFVAETLVPHHRLAEILTDNGLARFIPREPADSDVFRRVCRAAQAKKVTTSDPDVLVNILVRDVSHGDDKVLLKRIVAERVNARGKKLSYEEMFDVSFDKDSSTMSIRRTSSLSEPAADEAAGQIGRDFPASRGMVNGAAVRDVFNRALVGSKATSVRPSGGVYFVMDEHAGVLEGLKALANHVPGAFMATTPLPDNAEQREMLRESVEFASEAEISSIQAEIANLLKSGEELTGARIAALTARTNTLKAKAAAYTDLLETNLGRTNAGVDILNRQLGQLMAQLTGIPAKK